MPLSATHCPECGAPVNAATESVADAIHADLAKANLLRLRGDLKQAEEVCLRTLKRFPHSAPAHTMLGDLAFARHDWQQAVSWYELALDIVPDSTEDHAKLEDARRRLAEQDSLSTAEQLGMPEPRPRAMLLGGIALSVLAVGALGYWVFMGRSPLDQAPTLRAGVNTPVVLPDDPPVTPDVNSKGGMKPNPSAAKPQEDTEMARAIADKAPNGGQLVEAASEPGSKAVTLTFIANEGEDEALVAARLAKTALDLYGDLEIVRLRAVRDKTLVFTASAKRTDYEVTQSEQWQSVHSGDEQAFAEMLLSGEWKPGSDPQDSRDDQPSDGSRSDGEADAESAGRSDVAGESGGGSADPGGMPGG